jgi:hypothetical protein
MIFIQLFFDYASNLYRYLIRKVRRFESGVTVFALLFFDSNV